MLLGLAAEQKSRQIVQPESSDVVRYLTQKQLARRWSMSHRTLERWRCLSRGPVWLKIGGKVLYKIEDIMGFEISKVVRGSGLSDGQPLKPA